MDAELRKRLDTIETMLTYIMNSMMVQGLKVTVEANTGAVGAKEVIEVIDKLSDDAANIMVRYIEDYYTEYEEDEEDEN